jgi:hypothetical protein
MHIGARPQIGLKIRIGDWLHSKNSWRVFATADDPIDKSLDWSIERARSPRRMVVRSPRVPRR